NPAPHAQHDVGEPYQLENPEPRTQEPEDERQPAHDEGHRVAQENDEKHRHEHDHGEVVGQPVEHEFNLLPSNAAPGEVGAGSPSRTCATQIVLEAVPIPQETGRALDLRDDAADLQIDFLPGQPAEQEDDHPQQHAQDAEHHKPETGGIDSLDDPA